MIPQKVKKRLNNDPWMNKCCYCGKNPVEFHHTLLYSGRKIEKWYAITPLCEHCHRGNNGTTFRDAKDYAEWQAIMRGGAELQKDYPKFDWVQRKKYLQSKFL